MLRMAGNIFRTTLYASLGVLIGYYNFEVNGIIGLITNLTFLALGILAVTTWKPERKPSEQPSEPRLLNGTLTGVAVATPWVETDREEVGG